MSDETDNMLDYQREVRRLRNELQQIRAGGADEGKPRRLTLSEILQYHLDRMHNAGGEHSSVELTRNAKGDTQIKVSVRTGDSHEVQTAEHAAAKAREVYDALAMLYPMSSPAS